MIKMTNYNREGNNKDSLEQKCNQNEWKCFVFM